MSNYSHHNATTTSGGGGITATGLLQVAFIVLKLCHVIEWSWFWVLFPSILGCALAAVIFIVWAVIAIKRRVKRKRERKRADAWRAKVEQDKTAREAQTK